MTKPLIAFAVLRAIALTIAVAIAFGLHLPNADWMPIAALVAMKPSLDQTTLAAEQCLAGALIGAIAAAGRNRRRPGPGASSDQGDGTLVRSAGAAASSLPAAAARSPSCGLASSSRPLVSKPVTRESRSVVR